MAVLPFQVDHEIGRVCAGTLRVFAAQLALCSAAVFRRREIIPHKTFRHCDWPIEYREY